MKEKPAQDVSFKPPQNYEKKEHDDLDALFWKEESQSSISYFSSCSEEEKDLKSFQESSFPEKSNVLSRKEKSDSIYTVLRGEGTYIVVSSFRIKDCLFNLNLVVPGEESLKKEEPVFKKFIQSFK